MTNEEKKRVLINILLDTHNHETVFEGFRNRCLIDFLSMLCQKHRELHPKFADLAIELKKVVVDKRNLLDERSKAVDALEACGHVFIATGWTTPGESKHSIWLCIRKQKINRLYEFRSEVAQEGLFELTVYNRGSGSNQMLWEQDQVYKEGSSKSDASLLYNKNPAAYSYINLAILT